MKRDPETASLPPAGASGDVAPTGEKWTRERILWLHRWTDTLLGFATSRSEEYRFTPGQFARLGLAGSDGAAPVWRAYSLVARPDDNFLEFISVAVPGGTFTGRLALARPGDEILVDKNSYGFLTTERFNGGRELWMLGSGTGVGPYLSILRDARTLGNFSDAVLVHSVRYAAELAYRAEIEALVERSRAGQPGPRLHYVPVVTREKCDGAFANRVTELITTGRLQETVGLPLDLDRSRLMICGNPEMAADLRELLTERGFRVGRRSEPGQLAFENYW
jgi:ferredoxin--NADP+ reductase